MIQQYLGYTAQRRFRIASGVAIVGVVAIVLLTALTKSTLADTPQVDGSVGTWHFQYSAPDPEQDGSYVISYDYPLASAADVQLAANNLNQAAAEFAKSGTPFKTTIVFTHPLPVAEFAAFVHNTGITPAMSTLRAFDPRRGFFSAGAPAELALDVQGRPWIGHPLLGGKPLDVEQLTRFVGTETHLFGVYSTDVILDSQTYAQVHADSRVYAIDVMQQILTDAVRRAHKDAAVDQITIQGSLLYGAMERTGITPMPQKP